MISHSPKKDPKTDLAQNYNQLIKLSFALNASTLKQLKSTREELKENEAKIQQKEQETTHLIQQLKENETIQKKQEHQITALQHENKAITKSLLRYENRSCCGKHGFFNAASLKHARIDFLFEAVITGNIPAVIEWLAHEVIVNALDQFGNSPLHYAVKNNHREMVKLLLSHKADSKLRNKDGMTPSQYGRHIHGERLDPEVMDLLEPPKNNARGRCCF